MGKNRVFCSKAKNQTRVLSLTTRRPKKSQTTLNHSQDSMKTRFTPLLKTSAAMLALVALTGTIRAADVIKADNATNLNDPTAWVGVATPTAADVAVWDSTILTGPNTTLLGADTNWAGIRIANPIDLVTISAGNTLTNGASGIDMSAATTNLTIAAGISLGSAQTWNVGTDRTLTVSGVVSSTNRLTKEGAGTVLLSGANNYSGGTINNAGVLQINNGTGVGASAGGLTNNNGSTARINTSTSIANPVNFNGTVTIDLNNFANNAAFTGNWSGNGTVNFINQNNVALRTFTAGGSSANWSGFTGTINMGTNTGTLRINDGGGSGNTGNSLATVDLGTVSAMFLTRNRNAPVNLGVLLGGPGTRVLNGSSSSGTSTYSIGGKNVPFTFDGAFFDASATAALAITKVGSSTTILTGTNKYFGATTVSAGTLQVGNGGTLGQLGSGPIVNNAALVYNRSDAVTISNAISGSGNMTLQGGTVATFQGTNTSSGTLVVSAGAADVGASGSIQCPISLASGTYLIVTNNPTFTLNQTLSGVGTVDGGLTAIGGTISPAGSGAGGTLSFLNNLTNSGPVTYQMELATAGATDLVSITGDLDVTSTNSIIASKLGGGTLALGTYPLINYSGTFNGGLANFTVTVVGVTGTLTNPPGQIALIVTAAARGATNLTWVGDGGANSWDDNVSTNWVNGVAQFKFQAGDSVRFDAAGAANSTVNLNSAVLQPTAVVVDAATDYTLTGFGSISGSGGLTKTNSGTLSILTTNAYTGPTIIGGGTLDINGVGNGNSPSAIGASSSSPTNLVIYNSTLRYSGGNASTDHGATLVGGGNLDITASDLTFSGAQITGSGPLTKSGAGTAVFSVANSYTGGTIISNGILALGSNSANNDGAGGSGLGATNNAVTFYGGTLQLFGYNGGTGNNYATLHNPLIVPAGQSGGLRLWARGPGNSGATSGLRSSLTGSGTLNLVVNYVRANLDGDWSAFTGTINVTPKVSGDEMRINNNFGYSNATIVLNDGVNLGRADTGNTVNDIGALDGTSLAVVGPGNNFGANPTWRVGWKNTAANFAGTIANSGAASSIIKVGTGKWTLSGFNTYTGGTTISNGVLELTGSLASTNIAVVNGAFLDVSTLGNLPLNFGQTLSGNGTVNGGVDTTAGGTIAPGFSIGNLNVTNAVTLGGNALMEVNRAGLISDKLVAPSIAYGGTLTVVNAGAPLQIGDTFDLFDASLSGSFTTLNLGYYTWNTSQLGVNGTITVTGFLPPPTLSATYDGFNITLNAVGGIPGGGLAVVTSANADAPLNTWTTVQNDVFDGSGNYTLASPVDIGVAQRFYAIRAF